MAHDPRAGTVLDVVLPALHTGQLRRRAIIAARKPRFVSTMCGRRWGKSVDGGDWIADGAIDGQTCGWFAPTYKYLIEVWDDLSKRLRPISSRIDKTEKRIELLGGGLIECWTLDDPDAGRSRKYHRIVIDEAGLVRDLRTRWTMALRPTLVDYRGDAWFYGTPKGRSHDFSAMHAHAEQSGDPEWYAHRAPTRENPHIPADEIEAARRSMPEGAFLQEFEGIPADDGANPFGLDAIAHCVGPISEERPAVWGWDFARAQDWTVGIALDHAGRVCRIERWQQRPWGETKRTVADLTGTTPSAGDSTGIGDVIVEDLNAMRCPMTPIVFTPKSKQALMERLRAAIQTRAVLFPDGVLRSELETFGFEYTAHGVRYSAPDGLHDDCVMALALAVYAYDRVQPTLAAHPVPQHEQRRDTNRWDTYTGTADEHESVGGLGRGF